MKKIYFISLLFFLQSFLSLGQETFFEKSIEPDFNARLNAVIPDSSGNFYAVGDGGFGFSRASWFMKTDRNGNILFQVPLYDRDDNYLDDLIFTHDHNFLASGYSAYCDIAPPNQGIIYKLSPAGSVIWSKIVNPDTSWYSSDNNLRQVFEMQNGKILLRADSTLYFMDDSGDSLWTKVFTGGLVYAGEELNHRIIAANQSQIFLLDTLGNVISQFLFPSPITQMNSLEDSTYVIECGSNLLKLDSAFNTIAQFDFTQINYSAAHLTVGPGKIWIANLPASDFASFNLNLQLADTFRTQQSGVVVKSVAVDDTLIVVAGAEQSQRNYAYLKSYSTNGNYKYRPVDLELTSLSFDTTYGFHYINHPQGVNSIGFVAECTVTNTGSDTIHSFNINAHSQIIYGPCGPFEYIKRVTNINLLPGQIMSVTLDTLAESGIVFTPPFMFTFCAWVSCPDSVVDKNHSNDYLCDSFIVDEIEATETIDNESTMSIFPNPSSSEFTVSTKELSADAKLEIFNCFGERVYSSVLHQNHETINAKLIAGIYFVRLSDEERSFTQKLVIN